MAAARTPAVLVEGANKHYGTKGKANYKAVLTNLHMTVDRGAIYGLLGPSGCGKTTLLSCLVGRRHLDSGEIWVLGGRPGEKGSGVPGPRVGYMPQEIALVGELTIRDAIYYFGRVYGMEPKRLDERFEFLTSLLELGHGGRQIKNLSGGQQRRVSLAAALVHEPELLILDEPCVGLDPVLRERIWEFLAELARGGTSVIITTHYIDETKTAHKIGLLRDGYLLAEDPPDEIMHKFQSDTLEEAFLKLALRQHEEMQPSRRSITSSPDVIPASSLPSMRPASQISQISSPYQSKESFTITTSTDVLTKKDIDSSSISNLSKSRYKAVFIKSIQQFARHPGGLIFSVMFPIIQVVAFCAAIGHDPRDLKLGVVNEETAQSPWGIDICRNSSLRPVIKVDDDTCDLYMLSCWFLEEMENHQITQKTYNTTEEARDAIRRGTLYGALHFAVNFSEALGERVRAGNVDDDVVDSSTISVWLDSTNHQIAHFLKRQLHKSYETFTRRSMKACGRPENMVQIPVFFHEPIYGSMSAQYTGFMAPGIMMTIIFFLSAIVTSTLMISERLEGLWERSAVAGVKPHEMLNVHIVIQAVVILFQTVEMMLLGFAGYSLPSKGSLLTGGVLLFLQGLSGMCYGFLLSVCCSSYSLSFFIATGSFYPMILLCGILWPLEAMSKGLRIFAQTLPFTLPSKSLRDIMEKGSAFTDPEVYTGYLVTIVWTTITITMCFIKLRMSRS